MRLASIAVFVLLFSTRISADVRPVDHSAAALLRQAMQKSAVVRTLVEGLAHTDLIVHVEMSRLLPGGIGGTTRFVASRGDHRYLRITLSAALPPDARIAMLGHELQHAQEIAGAKIADVEALRRLLAIEGYATGHNLYETDAARRVEYAVREELKTRYFPTNVSSRQESAPDKSQPPGKQHPSRQVPYNPSQ